MPNSKDHSKIPCLLEMRLVMRLMIEAGINGSSYSQLCSAGIDDPDVCTAWLQKAGAIIEVKLRPAILSDGRLCDDIPHYIYKRWL